MAIDKMVKGGYAYNRPSYTVDTNVSINAGMVAFLATSGGVTVATTAASGTIPIGTFWKDSNTTYTRSIIEAGTFNASNVFTVRHPSLVSTTAVKVTNTAGTTVYTAGTDYTVAANGVITRITAGAGGSIAALATVTVWYEYNIPASQINYAGGSFQQGGTNYDRLPNDTLGSGKITVVEGFAHIYTDQFDVTQTYTLNASVRPNATSQWTTAASGYAVCGRVVQVPSASYPYLGVYQIPVP